MKKIYYCVANIGGRYVKYRNVNDVPRLFNFLCRERPDFNFLNVFETVKDDGKFRKGSFLETYSPVAKCGKIKIGDLGVGEIFHYGRYEYVVTANDGVSVTYAHASGGGSFTLPSWYRVGLGK